MVNEDNKEEKTISMVGFKKLCKKYDIYGKKSQKRYLESMRKTGLVKNLEDLKISWRSFVKSKFTLELDMIKNDGLTSLCEKLDTLFLNYSKKNDDKIWLNFKILESEIERINLEYFFLV